MQARVGPVALSCLKIGGASTLLSAPLGLVSLTAGETAYAGGIATMLVAGAVARAADRREMARLTIAARRALARVKVTSRQATAEPFVVSLGNGARLNVGLPATFNGNSANNEVN